jgi:putative Mg2+ transporter-C (MgtC) family protein
MRRRGRPAAAVAAAGTRRRLARWAAMLAETLAAEIRGGLAIPLPVVALRLVGAALLCALIGYERETGDHPAGLRTHMLVGVAAALYALVTISMVEVYAGRGDVIRMDPLRLAEALTSGVAFLAAGMIVLSRGKVRHLTTGAVMWLAAAVGLAAGYGFWAIAVMGAVLGLAIVAMNRLWPWT